MYVAGLCRIQIYNIIIIELYMNLINNSRIKSFLEVKSSLLIFHELAERLIARNPKMNRKMSRIPNRLASRVTHYQIKVIMFVLKVKIVPVNCEGILNNYLPSSIRQVIKYCNPPKSEIWVCLKIGYIPNQKAI